MSRTTTGRPADTYDIPDEAEPWDNVPDAVADTGDADPD